MMLDTQVAYSLQSFFVPHLAYWIMRIAEYHQSRFGIGQFFFQIVKIDRVPEILIHHFTCNNISLIIHNGIVENIINRGQYKHVVAGFGHFAYDRGYRRHNTGAEHNPFFCNMELMPLPPPLRDRIIIVIRYGRVSKNTMIEPLLKGSNNGRRRLEVHIRHPHGKFIGTNIPFI
ncbi:hypothetical protein D3C71_1344600 [compost metagenome]